MIRYTLPFLAAGLFLIGAATAYDGAPLVILDTDMRADCDDAGALAALHALADKGECEILGVMASTSGPHVVGTINAINTFYGRPELPVGLVEGEHTTGGDDYAPVVGDPERFFSTMSNEAAPDSATLYRRLLNDAPDNSVKIVVIGGQPCLYQFLQTEANHEGDGIEKTGFELAEQKVQELVLMAGNFANPEHGEWNITLHIPGAQLVAEEWPTPIVYSGYEIGRVIQTGARYAEYDPEEHPVAMAYKLYRGAGTRGTIGDRSSWDQAAVYYTVLGLEHEGEAIWSLSEPMDIRFDDEGRTRFEENPEANRRYKIQEMPIEETADLIEELMVRPPRMSIELETPSRGAAYIPGATVTLQASVTERDITADRVEFLVDGDPIAETGSAPYEAEWTPASVGKYRVQARLHGEDGARFYTQPAIVSIIEEDDAVGTNEPDALANLALLPDAQLSGSVEEDGRGEPVDILYDPAEEGYHVVTDWNEYGVGHEEDLGLVSEEDAFYWAAEWEEPKNVNYLTFGGTYWNQPQPFTMWSVDYRRDGEWRALREGQGGWINTGVFVWGQADGPGITADAVRVRAFSDGEHPLRSIHLRARGGVSENEDDSGADPKASLVLYK